MLFIAGKLIADAEELFDGIADGVETTVSDGVHYTILVAAGQCNRSHDAVHLTEVALIYLEYRRRVDIVIFKNIVDPLCGQLLVLLIRDALHQVAHFLTHAFRQCDTEVLLESVVYTALAGL